MASDSSSESDSELIHSKESKKKKKFTCKLGNKLYNRKKNNINNFLLDACEEEIKDIIKAKGSTDEIENLNISKEALHTIVLKLKKSIKAKDIDYIKSNHFKLINQNQEKLENLSNNIKLQNIKKNELKEFIKNTCKIDKTGRLFKILINLK